MTSHHGTFLLWCGGLLPLGCYGDQVWVKVLVENTAVSQDTAHRVDVLYNTRWTFSWDAPDGMFYKCKFIQNLGSFTYVVHMYNTYTFYNIHLFVKKCCDMDQENHYWLRRKSTDTSGVKANMCIDVQTIGSLSPRRSITIVGSIAHLFNDISFI